MVVMQGYGFGKSRPGDPQSIQNEAAEATTAAAAVAAATKASATATATSNSLTRVISTSPVRADDTDHDLTC